MRNSFKVSAFWRGFFASIFIMLGIFSLGGAVYGLILNPVPMDEYSGKYDAGILWLMSSLYWFVLGAAYLHERRKDQIWAHKYEIESRNELRLSKET